MKMKTDFYGMEKVSLVDYEGYVVCTLFTNNCNFRCPFCHNSPLVFSNVDAPLDFNEIINYLEKRKNVLDGVCITGGEPTLMSDLPEKLRKIKKTGLKIKLDTNGTNPKMLKALIGEGLIDYVAMDIKNAPLKYSMTIGLNEYSLDNIKESMKILVESNLDFEFRTTLVKEYHNDDAIKELALFLKGVNKLYLQHFVDRDSCIKRGLHEVPKEKALEYQSFLKNYINNVNLRGY